MIQTPTSAVLVDRDPATAGVQSDVRVRTTLRAGGEVRVVVLAGDGSMADSATGTVDDAGAITLTNVTLPSPMAMLRATGTDPDCGSAEDMVAVDVLVDARPEVSLAVVAPVLACGGTATPASDRDLVTDGVQVIARVTSTAAMRSLELTNSAGTTTLDAAGDVAVTLAAGANSLVGVGVDPLGGRGETAACTLSLAELSINFAAPAADGSVGAPDGAVTGNALTFPLCGTVDRTGAVVMVSLDGAPPEQALVTGTSWCRTVTLTESPPSHTIAAFANVGDSTGSASLVLRVDLTPPGPIDGFTARAIDRRAIELAWTAPSDGGQPAAAYLVKRSTAPLTEANFDSAGIVVAAGVPPPPGSPEQLAVAPLRTGAPVYVGIAAVDAAGNRSAASLAGPLALVFDQTGAIVSPEQNQGTLQLGTAIAHGKFNDDDFDDVAVSAPLQNAGATQAGAVHVYFGSPAGLAATPGLVIRGPSINARFGAAVTAIRRSSATRDDLVIGAPLADGGRGRLYLFDGGAALPAGSVTASTADLTIGVLAAAPGVFAGGNLGAALATADVDGDGLDDLIAAAPLAGGAGVVVIAYGGTITGDVELSDVDATGVAAVVELIADPGAVPGRKFGFYVHAVGPTEGAADATDDLVLGYFDDPLTAGDSLYVFRSDGARPMTPGLAARAFAPGRDVRIDLPTIYKVSEWGSQAVSIEDLDGDGARDLAIGAYRDLSLTGEILIVSGDTLGTAGIAHTNDAGVVITTIQGAPGSRLGGMLARHDARTNPDVDGDGREDLIAAGLVGGAARLFVWFGGAIPTGSTTIASAAHVIVGPPAFLLTPQRPQGPAGFATWIGDINGDGLDDVCWASPFDNTNGGDGGFEVLWDSP